MSTEGIRVGPPPRPARLQVCRGARARGAGREGAAAAAKEARGFLQSGHPRGRPPWPAWCAGLLARCLAWARQGRSSWPPAHSYLQALQRKTNDSPGTVDVSSGPPVPAAWPPPQPPTLRSHVCAGVPSAVWVVTSRFPKKEKEINTQIHVSPTRSLAAELSVPGTRRPQQHQPPEGRGRARGFCV